MKKLVFLSLAALILATALAGLPMPTAPEAHSGVAVGGSDYFLCAAFNTLKIGGMFLGRPDAVLVGAIGAGISCGFGW